MKVNKIYNEDCLETMSKMTNDFVDFVITSPPYNTGGQNARTGKNRKIYTEYKDNLTDEEYFAFLTNVINEAIRVTKHYVFFNFQILTNNKSVMLKLFSVYSENIKDIFIWKKQAVSQVVKGKMATGYEFVIILGKDNLMTFPYNNFPANNYVPNIKDIRKKKGESGIKNLNTATMPIALAEYFVIHFTKENDTIYDCFMGTGTTAIASVINKRKYIGSEISKKYCEIVEKRIKEIQPKLF